MSDQKLITQLIAVVAELEEACRCIRQNTQVAKLNSLLLKRHTAHMHALLLQHGIETIDCITEENGILVEQNVILVAQLEDQAKTLLRLETKLKVLHGETAGHREPSAVSATSG